MEIILTLFVVLFLIFLWWNIFLLKRYRKIKDLNFEITKKYYNDYDRASKEKKIIKERMRDLEDGIKENFGVSIRNEVTKIECVFDKVEMAFLMAGVYKLMNDKNSSIEDKEYYIRLYKKIQEHIEQMEDPKDES